MGKKPITTRMIAANCGFGQSTVSMALKNDPRIPEKTQLAILAVATQMGYRPDPHLARLMSGVKRRRVERQAQTLAYVLLWKHGRDYYHYRTFKEYRDGAQARAAEFGYVLEDFVVNDEGITLKRLDAILRARLIPGILFAPVSLSFPAARRSIEAEFSCVDYAMAAIGFSLATPVVDRATHDHAQAMELAVARLTKGKVRRVGLVCSQKMHDRVEGRWLSGFLLAQEQIPAMDRVRPLIIGDIRNEAVFDSWMDHERPSAIVAVEMDEVENHLRRRRLRVPTDISLAHLDVNLDSPAYAGVTQYSEAVGAAAFDLLLAQILRNERGVPAVRKTVMLAGAWQDGPTVRRR